MNEDRNETVTEKIPGSEDTMDAELEAIYEAMAVEYEDAEFGRLSLEEDTLHHFLAA